MQADVPRAVSHDPEARVLASFPLTRAACIPGTVAGTYLTPGVPFGGGHRRARTARSKRGGRTDGADSSERPSPHHAGSAPLGGLGIGAASQKDPTLRGAVPTCPAPRPRPSRGASAPDLQEGIHKLQEALRQEQHNGQQQNLVRVAENLELTRELNLVRKDNASLVAEVSRLEARVKVPLLAHRQGAGTGG